MKNKTPTSEWKRPDEINPGSICFCVITATAPEESYYYVAVKTENGWENQEGDVEDEPNFASLIYSY